MKIYSFDPKTEYTLNKKEIQKAILNVLESGKYILSDEVRKLENTIKKLLNVKNAVSVKNGTDALIISLKILGIKKGDEIITTSHTALATTAAIINVGAKPVIIDIDKEFYTLDSKKIENKINKKTKAILPVHIYGQCCDMKDIMRIANKYNLYVIEDCSQALGSKIKNKYVGTFGDIGTISFYPTKNFGALGDGGMIITNNSKIFKKIERYREYGWDRKRNTNNVGINSRLDEIQAAILNLKLKYFKMYLKEKNRIAKKYISEIKNLSIILPKIRKNSFHSFHIFAILTKSRKHFLRYLKKHNIFLSIHYNKLTFENKGYTKNCEFSKLELKNSLNVSKSTLSLPIYNGLSEIKLNKIIKVINNYKQDDR